MKEDEETNAGKPSSYIKSLVEEAEIGEHRRHHKQRRLWPELDEDGKSTDDEAKQVEEKMERPREVGENSNKEIIKELKKIQRQNSITHYLLTASILVTLAWQLSEFSLIFRIKQRFNNPSNQLQEHSKGSSFIQQPPKIMATTTQYRSLHQPISPASRSPICPVLTPATMTTTTNSIP